MEDKVAITKESRSKPQMPVVAIDFGLKRIGVAVSDSKGIVATPLATLVLSENKSLEDLSIEIRELADSYRAKTYLVGLPQAFVKSHEKIRNLIRKFASHLEKDSERSLIFYDESFSTKQSTDMLISLGYRKDKLKSVVDKSSAAYFLQEFLDNIK